MRIGYSASLLLGAALHLLTFSAGAADAPTPVPPPPLGANYLPPSVQVKPASGGMQNVSFTVSAPSDTAKAFLSGTFNGWSGDSLPMKKSSSGAFTASIPLKEGYYEYKFVLVNQAGQATWKEDALNRLNVDDGQGGRNSVVLVTPPGNSGSSSSSKSSAGTGQPIRWNTDIAVAFQEARKTNKRIFIFFGSSSATVSRYMEDNVFTDNRVRAAVSNNFIPVRIDTQLQAALTLRFGVNRGGIIAIYTSQGQGLAKLEGMTSPDKLIDALDKLPAGTH